MLGAVKCNRRPGKPSNTDIEEVVKLWQRYACHRAGGRSNRRSKQQQQQDEPDSD